MWAKHSRVITRPYALSFRSMPRVVFTRGAGGATTSSDDVMAGARLSMLLGMSSEPAINSLFNGRASFELPASISCWAAVSSSCLLFLSRNLLLFFFCFLDIPREFLALGVLLLVLKSQETGGWIGSWAADGCTTGTTGSGSVLRSLSPTRVVVASMFSELVNSR